MKRPQARFHILAGLLAQMGISFVAPPEGMPRRKSGYASKKQIFQALTGWRHREVKTQFDDERIQAAVDRRLARAIKRHADYLKCLANNPCLNVGVAA